MLHTTQSSNYKPIISHKLIVPFRVGNRTALSSIAWIVGNLLLVVTDRDVIIRYLLISYTIKQGYSVTRKKKPNLSLGLKYHMI